MADATLRITAQDDTKAAFSGVLARLQGFQRDAERSADTIRGVFDKITVALAGVGAVEFGKEIIRRAADSERAVAHLNATLIATRNAAGFSSSGLQALAEDLSKATTFNSDEILKGIDVLLRFRTIYGETFERATKLAIDLAAATDRDVVGAFQRVGRAVSQPETGLRTLREAGVALDDSQKELITRLLDANKVAAAGSVVMDELAKSIGGGAAGENVGTYGAIKATDKAWDEFLKTLGKTGPIATAAQGSLGLLTDLLHNITAAIKEQDDSVRKQILSRAGLLAAPTLPGARQSEEANKLNDALAGKTLADVQKLNQAPSSGRIGPELPARRPKGDAGLDQVIKAQLQAALDAEKQLGSQRQQILDDYHARGLVSEKAFYDARLAITQSEIKAEIAALDLAIAQQRKLVETSKPEEKNAKQAELIRLEAQRGRLESDINFAGIKAAQDLEDGQKKLADAVAEVNAQLFEQQHSLAQAAAIRFETQHETLRNQITSNFGGDSSIMKRVDQLKELTVANAQLNELQERGGLIRDQLATQEERIQNSQRVGAIGELEALRQTDAARKASLASLRDVAEQMELIARKTKDPAQLQAVEQLKAQIDALAASADLLGDKFRTVFADSATSALDAFIGRTKSAGQAFLQFGQDVVRALIHIMDQEIAMQIFGRLGIGGAIGDVFSGIFGPISGGAGGAAASRAGSSSFAGRMAGGGSLDPGQFAVVGEHGPELLFAGGKGQVMPNAGGGGLHVTVNINDSGISGAGGLAGVAALARQIASVVAQSEIVRQQLPGGSLFADKRAFA